MIDALHFLRPYWLFALLPVALGWWFGFRRSRCSAWERMVQPALLRVLMNRSADAPRGHRPQHWLAAACAGAVIALAGPAWQRLPQSLFHDRAALVIALDLSQSMLARDITPSRVKRARLKIRDLLSKRRQGDTALVAYAGNAFAVTPLTQDAHTIENLVAPLKPGIMPGHASNPKTALTRAGELVHRSGRQAGDVVLITDGLGSADTDQLAGFANQQGLRVSILAMATTHPAPVPKLNGIGTLHHNGKAVTDALDKAALRKLAAATGGRYQAVRRDAQDIANLQQLLDTRHAGYRAIPGRATNQWYDLGPWILLVLCLPMATYLFRRNLLFMLLVCLVAPVRPSHAADWGAAFLNSDQRGLAAYDKGDYQSAKHLFSDRRWQAAAAYKEQAFRKALALYSQFDDIASVYNRGNTLAKLARYRKAIRAYNEVLDRAPGYADAAYNKAQVLKLLKHKNPQNRKRHSSRDSGRKGDQKNRSRSRQNNAGARSSRNNPNQREKRSRDNSAQADANARSQKGKKPTQNNRSLEAKQAGGKDADRGDYHLRRIPDDPSALLRRKFRYENQHRTGQQPSGSQW